MLYTVTYNQYGRTYKELVTKDMLKQKCIDILNNRGWDNKEDVDLRNIQSMAKYSCTGCFIGVQKGKCLDKV